MDESALLEGAALALTRAGWKVTRPDGKAVVLPPPPPGPVPHDVDLTMGMSFADWQRLGDQESEKQLRREMAREIGDFFIYGEAVKRGFATEPELGKDNILERRTLKATLHLWAKP